MVKSLRSSSSIRSMSEPLNLANAPSSLVDSAGKKAKRRKRFEEVFPLLKQELLEYLDECRMPQEARDWYDNVGSSKLVSKFHANVSYPACKTCSCTKESRIQYARRCASPRQIRRSTY